MNQPRQSKLPVRLNHEYDRKIIDAFREWEKMERKISTFRNHLYSTLHCKHHGVFPPSLTLKSSMTGPNAQRILRRAQLALMNERISGIRKQLQHFRNIRTTKDEFLFTQLPSDLYMEVGQWMVRTRNKWFYDIQTRHQNKFARLLRKNEQCSARENEPIVDVTAAEKEAIQSKWVVNVSDRVLSPDKTSLLKKGLNFAIAPKNILVDQYVIGIESACRHIGPESQQAAKLRADCVRLLQHAKPPTSNITNAERKALTTLAKDADITILPADKGRAVLVMNTSDYREKAKNILSNTNTYKVLKKDPTSKYKTQLSSKLQEIRQLNEISDVEHRRLLPTSTLTPRFYGLPKVHKASAPLRPIVASRGSITYGVARYVADILSPLVGKNGYALKNSEDMVNSLSNCTLQEDDILVSFDVTALFTKVPVDKSVEIIHDRLTRDTSLPSRTRMTANHVRDLLLTCLKTTYFLYDGVIYSQVEGAAMGSPVSPIVANLFMEWFEGNAINTFMYEISLWKRYVDDTIVVLDDSLLEDFTNHINAIHPSIKFTREEEENNTIPMLDAKTTRDTVGMLSFTVYRKPTHTDQYLQFASNQPLNHKLGVIRTLRHRCDVICSTEEAKLQELEHLKKVLSVSGYTKTSWDIVCREKPPTVPRDPQQTRQKGHVTLPYVGHVSDALARTIRKAGVAVHLKPYNNIRSHLVRPKDKVPKEDKPGVIYRIKCGECSASYVGETGRQLKDRVTSTSWVPCLIYINEEVGRKLNRYIIHQCQGTVGPATLVWR